MADLMPQDWDDMEKYLALYDGAATLLNAGTTVSEAAWRAIWEGVDQMAAVLDLEVARP